MDGKYVGWLRASWIKFEVAWILLENLINSIFIQHFRVNYKVTRQSIKTTESMQITLFEPDARKKSAWFVIQSLAFTVRYRTLAKRFFDKIVCLQSPTARVYKQKVNFIRKGLVNKLMWFRFVLVMRKRASSTTWSALERETIRCLEKES